MAMRNPLFTIVVSHLQTSQLMETVYKIFLHIYLPYHIDSMQSKF